MRRGTMDTSTLMALAQSAVDVGNINAACEFYEAALNQSPNNDEVMEAYAEVLIHHAQNADRARQLLRHAIEVNPRQGYIKYANLAQLCEAEEALRLYTTAHEVASRALASCRKKRARAALQEAVATICCAIAELYMTDLCFAEQAETQCEEALTRALALCGTAVEPHQLLGSLRINQQRLPEAHAALRHAVDLTHRLSEEHQPSYESKIELARLMMQVSPDDAFGFLLEVLQLGDNNPYVWFLLGECARMRRRYVDAARLLRRARVMLVVSDGDAAALQEVDAAIGVLVSEMGGPEALAQITDLDALNPIALLQPEEEGEGEKDGAAGNAAGHSDDDDDDEEPEWEACDEEDEEEQGKAATAAS